jgi:hypothetical protein
VGQTSRNFNKRLKEHIRHINKHFIFKNDTTEVGIHFNLPLHNFRCHLRAYIIKDNLKEKTQRFSFENDMIHIISNVTNRLMNSYIPNKYRIKTFSFK